MFCAIPDYKVPFVPSVKEYEVVSIREGERVVIPCRGSMENLNVTLNTVRKKCFLLLLGLFKFGSHVKLYTQRFQAKARFHPVCCHGQ